MADVIAWAKIKDAKDAVLEALTNVQGGLSGTLSTMSSTLNTVKNSNLIKNGSAVKSVQRGTYAYTNGSTSISGYVDSDVQISSVATGKAIVIATTRGTSSSTIYSVMAELTSATNIKLTYWGRVNQNIQWQVIEFY